MLRYALSPRGDTRSRITVFIVIAITNPDAVQAQITAAYASDNVQIRDSVWTVSDSGTSRDVCTKLKITTDAAGAGPSGTGVVTGISGYYGAAAPNIWEFLRNKG
jgi:hypothetical protein